MKTAIRIRITSPNNPDWDGEWTKANIEEQMRDVECCPTSDTDWLYWVIEHVFDMGDLDAEEEKFICENQTVSSIKFDLPRGVAVITKHYDKANTVRTDDTIPA